MNEMAKKSLITILWNYIFKFDHQFSFHSNKYSAAIQFAHRTKYKVVIVTIFWAGWSKYYGLTQNIQIKSILNVSGTN